MAGRLTKKQRKRTLTEEVMADQELTQVGCSGRDACAGCMGGEAGRPRWQAPARPGLPASQDLLGHPSPEASLGWPDPPPVCTHVLQVRKKRYAKLQEEQQYWSKKKTGRKTANERKKKAHHRPKH